MGYPSSELVIARGLAPFVFPCFSATLGEELPINNRNERKGAGQFSSKKGVVDDYEIRHVRGTEASKGVFFVSAASLSNRLVIQRLRLGMIVGVLRRQECGASNRVFEQRRRGLAIVGDDLL